MNFLITLLALLFINPVSGVTTNTPAQEVVEIVIESNDQMKFNMSEITVPAGATVKLTLKHVGQLPAAAMGHNWVLLTQDTEMGPFAQAAVQARDNDYIPAEGYIVYTDLIGGGEETTIEFEAPAAGEYTFICSFPGHYALMNGKFIVE
jgi:azurin